VYYALKFFILVQVLSGTKSIVGSAGLAKLTLTFFCLESQSEDYPKPGFEILLYTVVSRFM